MISKDSGPNGKKSALKNNTFINAHDKNLPDLMNEKKEILSAVSFSDTFDVLTESGNLESKIPEEIPMFVDPEPIHFSKPARRSYKKCNRAVNSFDSSCNYNNDTIGDGEADEDVEPKPKKRKKKMDSFNKAERKLMQDWVESVNKTYEEIELFDLVVE